jgi:hypothetical protein
MSYASLLDGLGLGHVQHHLLLVLSNLVVLAVDVHNYHGYIQQIL